MQIDTRKRLSRPVALAIEMIGPFQLWNEELSWLGPTAYMLCIELGVTVEPANQKSGKAALRAPEASATALLNAASKDEEAYHLVKMLCGAAIGRGEVLPEPLAHFSSLVLQGSFPEPRKSRGNKSGVTSIKRWRRDVAVLTAMKALSDQLGIQPTKSKETREGSSASQVTSGAEVVVAAFRYLSSGEANSVRMTLDTATEIWTKRAKLEGDLLRATDAILQSRSSLQPFT
ncbi:hypothetical protein [Aliiroseovarius sp. YM-037]|uniref:hypothetical protein n=1 Tax=Aliiroseovarius sp. YM-037 TaxID=3341728 RepID=UPI003A80FA42